MKKILSLSVALACLAVAPASAEVITITVNTANLISHAAGPFYLDFVFTDGSFIGDGNNTVTISAFDFGLGGSAGSLFVTPSGDSTGDLLSGITMTDTSFFAEFGQSFNPGSQLSFSVNFTDNVDSPTPDGFMFSILDSSLSPIPTLAPGFQDFVFSIDMDGQSPTTQLYGGDTSRSPVAGGAAIDFDAQYPSANTSVPEPSAAPMIAAVLLGAAFRRRSGKK